MKRMSLLLALAMAFAAGGASARDNVTDPSIPRQLPASGPVSVEWTDPAQFSELRYSGNRWEAERGNWVVELARHLQARAARHLAPGQRLQVTITDITRAGSYLHPGSVRNDIRIVQDMYPPRMSLHFRLTDEDGAVVSEGERKLRDPAFLSQAGANNSDALRYEKRMIDDWLRQEFGPAR